MAKVTIEEILNNFPFLSDRSAQEPYLYQVLLEIRSYQKKFLAGKLTKLATREILHKSRNVKLPLTPTRDKNLDYLIEHLLDDYNNNIKKVISFEFDFNDKKKNLVVKEIEEFTVDMPVNSLNEHIMLRDNNSALSLLKLISRFRIFNLTKLLSTSKHKQEVSRIIKIALGKSIFTFKNFKLNNVRIEVHEDYCFHIKNYDKVKGSLDSEKLKEIIAMHMDLLKRKLDNYGIYNANFGDYRDKKVDYILHILIDDIGPSIAVSDQIFIKNYQSLRSCILKVDKALDPAKLFSQEIVKFIHDNQYVIATDITSNLIDVTQETLKRWTETGNIEQEHIIHFIDDTGYEYFLDGNSFINTIQEIYHTLRYSPETLASMSSNQKNALQSKMDILYLSARKTLEKANASAILNCSSEEKNKLKQLLNDYEEYITELSLRSEQSTVSVKSKKKSGSIIKKIFSFFSTMFSSKSDDEKSSSSNISSKKTKGISKETKQIYVKAKSKKGPIIALSDFIEINRENDASIDKIINDLRNNNIKIVIPIYNARTVLYPKRSQKLLIADIEYLLAPPSAIATQESITSYIDSLVGFKMRDDFLSGKALIAIERYLRTLYRQKRAVKLSKKEKKSK